MKNCHFLKMYAKHFGYKEFKNECKDKIMYLKRNDSGFIVIEKLAESKYVNFYFNENVKTFKETDLALSVIEQTPIAWEEETCM